MFLIVVILAEKYLFVLAYLQNTPFDFLKILEETFSTQLGQIYLFYLKFLIFSCFLFFIAYPFLNKCTPSLFLKFIPRLLFEAFL